MCVLANGSNIELGATCGDLCGAIVACRRFEGRLALAREPREVHRPGLTLVAARGGAAAQGAASAAAGGAHGAAARVAAGGSSAGYILQRRHIRRHAWSSTGELTSAEGSNPTTRGHAGHADGTASAGSCMASASTSGSDYAL